MEKMVKFFPSFVRSTLKYPTLLQQLATSTQMLFPKCIPKPWTHSIILSRVTMKIILINRRKWIINQTKPKIENVVISIIVVLYQYVYLKMNVAFTLLYQLAPNMKRFNRIYSLLLPRSMSLYRLLIRERMQSRQLKNCSNFK